MAVLCVAAENGGLMKKKKKKRNIPSQRKGLYVLVKQTCVEQ